MLSVIRSDGSVYLLVLLIRAEGGGRLKKYREMPKHSNLTFFISIIIVKLSFFFNK